MIETKQSQWIVRTNDFKQAPVSEIPVSCTQKDLVPSSLKKLGFFGALAVVSVFLPVLHFFLVPLFLLIGVFAFFSHMKNNYFLKTGTFECPNCKTTVELKNFYFKADQRFQCKHCQQQLVLTQAG